LKLNRLAGKRPAAMALSLVVTAALAVTVTGSAHAAPSGSGETALYLVQTASEPLSKNQGTKPSAGQKVNARTARAADWMNRLRDEHDATLRASRISTDKKVYDYGVVFNGYAARLTKAEAARLKGTGNVVNVWKNEIRYADTTTTRDFLGLTGSKGVWQKQFGGNTHAGEGMIVGVIDSGIWPENPAFAALSEPRPDAAAIAAKWHGTCDVGVEQPIACNNKLIGARYFNEGYGDIWSQEFESPRDYGGHGSHTASTAAGNFGVPASINGYSMGTTSGVAPAARIAVYKALWEGADGQGSGTTADLVAAIDQAVADGVDVINYSISGSSTYVVTPDEIAFLFAADAGVFVSTSAGNSGDTIGDSSVAHNSPWTTTVAASTQSRGSAKTVTLGNGTSYTGPGVIPIAVPSSPLVTAGSIAATGANPAEAALCFTGTLDAAKAAGKIVICDRGVNDRVAKSRTVADAGGVGVVLANTSDAQSLNGDFHAVPTVHVTGTQGAAIKAYAASPTATAALSATDTSPVTAPAMAGFSSYGPALAGNGDLLKPDITGPGVDIIASVAPPGNAGKDFDAYSGTSMSAPHIAGIAALIKAKHPTWSPMAVKSAMMTTASTKDSAGNTIQWSQGDATPLNFGAGHVQAGSAFDPGLVYDSGFNEWIQYGCGIGQMQLVYAPSVCQTFGSIDPSNLNYPSIAVGDLAGSQVVTRTVTNVSNRIGLYFPLIKAPAGFTVKVSTPVLILRPGKSVTFKITITRTSAALQEYAFGSLTWLEIGTGLHKVTSPIVARPVGIAAATEVNGTGVSGSSAQSVTPGFTGTLSAGVSGLTPSAVTDLAFTGTETGFAPSAPAVGAGVKKVTVTVPAGTVLSRVATFDGDLPANTDVDLFAYPAGTSTLVGQSAGGTAEESIALGAGTYDIYVVLFAATGLPSVKFHAFTVPAAAAGNLTVSPASLSVTTGVAASVTFTWSGLTAGSRYLGVVRYSDGSATIGQTVVAIAG
jgi:subtilisin family serine protease